MTGKHLSGWGVNLPNGRRVSVAKVEEDGGAQFRFSTTIGAAEVNTHIRLSAEAVRAMLTGLALIGFQTPNDICVSLEVPGGEWTPSKEKDGTVAWKPEAPQ